MTEAEWLAATEPTPMLEHLGGTATDRKLRLFACACCRRVWHLAKNPRLKQVLPIVEGFADGALNDRDRGRAYRLSLAVMESRVDLSQQCLGAELWRASKKTLNRKEYNFYKFGESASAAVSYTAGEEHAAFLAAKEAEFAQQTLLVRDIFGNPFRPVIADPAWLTSTVLALVRRLSESQDLSAMPILADALQDAGCEDPDVLGHCRGDRPHVRGCWVVDLILGKK